MKIVRHLAVIPINVLRNCGTPGEPSSEDKNRRKTSSRARECALVDMERHDNLLVVRVFLS
jgi:hypothetical protein